ncbi:MAG: hypothetical protein H7Z37_04800 [Pyrinomonadaceae bacterium]|nr:hypothetical protein [Pyrinomonadaceae bacterium]
MLIGFILLLIMTFGGFAVTYFYDDDDAPFFVRVCAGIVVGQVAFSLVSFLIGCAFGMSVLTLALSLAITALPLAFLPLLKVQRDFAVFLQSLKSFFVTINVDKIGLSVIYVALSALLWRFFSRAMLDVNGAFGTGSPHNIGDLSFHLQAIYGFLNGQNFPPQNPSYAGAVFTYPFMADLITAFLAFVGMTVADAMFYQNIFLIVALIVLFHHFTFKITHSRIAAHIAPFLLLFDGGFGFVMYVQDAIASEQGVFGYLFNMPTDYTIRGDSTWRWGNSLTTLFFTQRSLLLGLPLTLIILTEVWKLFNADSQNINEANKADIDENKETFNFQLSTFNFFTPSTFNFAILGLFAGTLPLVHAHSFAVLMGTCALLALMRLNYWREWFAFFAAAGLIAVPELLWAILQSATKGESFIGFQFGWDNKNQNFFWFWLKNTGLFIPLLIAAIAILVANFKSKNVDSEVEIGIDNGDDAKPSSFVSRNLILFYLPFVLCFVIPNTVRLAPWIWDNVKVLIYWFVISVPLVALLLARIWQHGKFGKLAASTLILILMFSGFLDVWRIADKQVEYVVFERDAVIVANQVKAKTAPHSLVLSAPMYNAAAAIMGRRWFLGYIGHLISHGVNPTRRDEELKRIYSGEADALEIIRRNNIEYIVVSPIERSYMTVNDNFFSQFPVVASSGEYRVYQVKQNGE